MIQRSTVHVAHRAAPHDVERWRRLPLETPVSFRLALALLHPGPWPAEESDLGELSERFPGTLFVSDSASVSEPDTRWRMFALDGRTWRCIETGGVWAPPLALGLP